MSPTPSAAAAQALSVPSLLQSLRRPPAWLITALLMLCASWAQAQSVMLTGSIGNRAILSINGGHPRTLAPGQTLDGVKFIGLQNGAAVVEANGRRSTLQMDTAVSIGGSGAGAGGSRIVLNADSRGHFLTPGRINGGQVQFLLDTGATTIALSAADAQRLGLDTRRGQPVQMRTANGVANGVRMRLNSVRVGDVEVFDVEAVISPQPMPYVLLGNSFLNRFSMRRDADQMVLERRF